MIFKPFTRSNVKAVQKKKYMKDERNNLESLKGKNPFSVPEGYLEGLTTQIMSQLPEKPRTEQTKRIPLMERVRPWLYMAAVFAGLGLFFKGIVAILPGGTDATPSLLVKTDVPADSLNAIEETEEDEEYLEYIEAQYTHYLLAEELALSEENIKK